VEIIISPPIIAQVPDHPAPTKIQQRVWSRAVGADRDLKVRDRLVAMCLFLDGADPTYDEIGKSAGCGRRTAMRAVATLVKRGWLVKISSTGRVPNTYGMVMRPVAS